MKKLSILFLLGITFASLADEKLVYACPEIGGYDIKASAITTQTDKWTQKRTDKTYCLYTTKDAKTMNCTYQASVKEKDQYTITSTAPYKLISKKSDKDCPLVNKDGQLNLDNFKGPEKKGGWHFDDFVVWKGKIPSMQVVGVYDEFKHEYKPDRHVVFSCDYENGDIRYDGYALSTSRFGVKVCPTKIDKVTLNPLYEEVITQENPLATKQTLPVFKAYVDQFDASWRDGKYLEARQILNQLRDFDSNILKEGLPYLKEKSEEKIQTNETQSEVISRLNELIKSIK